MSSMAKWHMLSAMPQMMTAAEAAAQLAAEAALKAGNKVLSHCSEALPCLAKPTLCSGHLCGGLSLPKALGLLLSALGLLLSALGLRLSALGLLLSAIGLLLSVPQVLLMFPGLSAKAHDLLSRAPTVPASVPGPQSPSKTQNASQGAWVVSAGCKDCDTETAAPCK